MQQFIYILKLNAPYRKTENWDESTRQIIAAHFEYLKEKATKGIAQLVGKSDYDIDNDDNFGMVIFSAENENAAKTIMNNDPAVKEGIMYAVVHPFKIVLTAK